MIYLCVCLLESMGNVSIPGCCIVTGAGKGNDVLALEERTVTFQPLKFEPRLGQESAITLDEINNLFWWQDGPVGELAKPHIHCVKVSCCSYIPESHCGCGEHTFE